MIGKTISSYEVLAQAGSGGMGEVYQARDRRLGRLVALKVIQPQKSADPRSRKRLIREAQAASKLNHPGIVAVHDIGHEEGVDFIVMEWVSGRVLGDLIPTDGFSMAEAVSYFAQLADAVAAAHREGVIHRDLKPQNIMVTDEGQLKVLDFGIAKFDEVLDVDTLTEEESLTMEGFSPGTVAYMSPEQALGETLDHRSDIFALGVILYELLTGRRPFHAAGGAATLRQVIFADPPPITSLRPEVPEPLAKLLHKALEKKPDKRFQTVSALAANLRQPELLQRWAHLDKNSGSSPAVTVQPETPERRVPIGALIALSVGLLLVLIVAMFFRAGLFGVPSMERVEESSKVEQAQSPYEIFQQGQTYLKRYDREGYIDLAIDEFKKALRLAQDYAPAHSGIARAYWRKYLDKGDRVWLDRAHASVQRSIELDPQLIYAKVTLGRVLTAQGKLEEAEQLLQQQRRLDPANGEILVGLAEIEARQHQAAQAVALLKQAIELQPEDWELHSELGIAQASTGNLAAAEEAFLSSIELLPDNAFAYRNLGGIYHYQGRYGNAASALQKSISIRPTSTAYSNLGTIYFFQGLYRESAAAFEAAQQKGANHYLLWANLGDAYRQIPGREEDSIAAFQRAIQLLKKAIEMRPGDLSLKSRLALYLAKRGEEEAALKTLIEISSISEKSADTTYRAALVYELAGQRSLALETLAAALASGYPLAEIEKEPELVHLREDVVFHRLAARFTSPE